MSLTGQLAEAVLTLTVDASRFGASLASAEATAKAKIQSMNSVLTSVRNVSAIAFGAGVVAIKGFVDAASRADDATKTFSSTLKVMGDSFAAAQPELERTAAALGKAGDYLKVDLLPGLAQLVQVTGSVKAGELAMADAVNLARLKHIDLNEAVMMVSSAFNGQQRGLKKLIGDLGEHVKGMDALNAIQKKVGGGALATADEVSRAQDRMKVKWEETREKLGKDLEPTVRSFYKLLTDVADFVSGHLSGSFVAYTTVILGLTAAVATAWKWFNDFRLLNITLAAAQKAAALATATETVAIEAEGAAAATAAVSVGTLTTALWAALAAAVALKAHMDALQDQEGLKQGAMLVAHTPGGGRRVPNSGVVQTGEGPQSPAQMAAEGAPSTWETFVSKFAFFADMFSSDSAARSRASARASQAADIRAQIAFHSGY